MGIAYNAIQNKSCVNSFCCTHLDEVLIPFTDSPVLETRLLAKFVMGYLLPVLTETQKKTLVLKPDEISYLLSTVMGATLSEDYTANGYSAVELLRSLHNVVSVQKNILLLVSAGILDVLEVCLCVPKRAVQEASLNLSWSLILSSASKQLFSSSASIRRVILSMLPDEKLHHLHKAICFGLQQESDKSKPFVISHVRGTDIDVLYLL